MQGRPLPGAIGAATARRRWSSFSGKACLPKPRCPTSSCSTWTCPRGAGQELLTDIRADPRLQHIPVIVLTGSLVHKAVSAGPKSAGRRLHDQAGELGAIHRRGQVVAAIVAGGDGLAFYAIRGGLKGRPVFRWTPPRHAFRITVAPFRLVVRHGPGLERPPLLTLSWKDGSNAPIRSRKLATQLLNMAVAALVLSAIAAAQASAALRAGVAAVNITADKPADPVRDPLMAKALVLEDGGNKAVIISLDLVVVPETLVANIRRGVQQELGIDPSCILVNASHNHDTLDAMAGDMIPRIVKAVKQAGQNLVPARVGVGVGREDRITINRRLRMKDGTHWTIRRATPLPKDADVAGTGPLDPQIGLLRVDTLAGKPLALVYNFACHAYCGTPGGGISADFPGFASRVIEEAWPGAVALFVQGAAGDITPVRYKDFDAPAPTEQLGTRLGLSALHAAQAIATDSKAGVRVLSETIQLPRRTDTAERIQALLAEQEKILENFTGVGCGSHGAGVALDFKSFLPLYMKYTVDAEHPVEASYSYQQEAAAGQNGLRQLDVDNRKRLDTYRRCIENMDKLITVRTNLTYLKEHLEKEDGADRGRNPGVEDRRFRAGDVSGRAFCRSRPADQEAVAVSQDVRGGLLERLAGLRTGGGRLRSGGRLRGRLDPVCSAVAGDLRAKSFGDDRPPGAARGSGEIGGQSKDTRPPLHPSCHDETFVLTWKTLPCTNATPTRCGCICLA